MLVNRVLGTISQSIKKVIQNTQELDKCLVDIQIATGKSATQTQELLREYNNLDILWHF